MAASERRSVGELRRSELPELVSVHLDEAQRSAVRGAREVATPARTFGARRFGRWDADFWGCVGIRSWSSLESPKLT